MITIKGQIKFPRTPGRLPHGSCLVMKFEDVSMQDAASVRLASLKTNMSNSFVNDVFDYSLKSKKPIMNEFWRTYTISAVLNVGWCPGNNSDEWVRAGDYLTDTHFGIPLNNESDIYYKNIHVKCYGKMSITAMFETHYIVKKNSGIMLFKFSEIRLFKPCGIKLFSTSNRMD